MDRNWDSQYQETSTRNKGARSAGRKAQASAIMEQPFREAENDLWDFERVSPEGEAPGFAFTRREDRARTYRVLGEKSAARQAESVNPIRQNRFNSSIKIISSEDSPAPWDDWANISYLKMPVTGEVAAGRYDVTVAYHEPGYGSDAEYVLVNSSEVKVNRSTFALRVRGQSMIDNEIDDGDIIIVQAQNYADDGDIVVACLTDSSDSAGFVTLKRFYRHRQADRVVLQPANQALSPIHILPRKGDSHSEDLDGVKIQGRVTAIIKPPRF
ncbi:MAG TPA: S24 family peptidase [Chloroflexia bacterium]|nr:S24 family peptidase [Chloroflexia bacterium]